MITIDWTNQIVQSTSSITDIVVFHNTLRDFEDDAVGIVYPVIHKWKTIDLGGGAFFYALDFINGWRLQFPSPGTYDIIGNVNAEIIPTAGAYVERKTSAAFSTTTAGSVGATAEEIAQEVWKAIISGSQIPGSAGSLLQDISGRIASQ